MIFSAVLLFFPVSLGCQDHDSAGLTFGTTGYFGKGQLCGSHYTFDLVLRNWNEAKTYCRSQGGDLVSIETAEEHEYLKQIIAKNRQNPLLKAHVARASWFGFWTSGSDTATEGKFVWTATGMPVTLNKWSPRQPDNARTNEDHIQIFAQNGLLNDMTDSYRLFSICEF